MPCTARGRSDWICVREMHGDATLRSGVSTEQTERPDWLERESQLCPASPSPALPLTRALVPPADADQ